MVIIGWGASAHDVRAEAKSACHLYQDANQLMHFKSESSESFFWCFGYLHGRDRIWQMDFLRKTLQGRKAEIHGFSALKQDFMMRIMGFDSHAERIFAEMSDEQKRPWQMYARGVNRGVEIALKEGVLEFQKLNYQPEEWKPQDSIALLLLQSFDQTNRTFRQEMKEFKWKARYGDRAADLTRPDGLPWETTVLKSGEYPKAALKKDEQKTSQNSAPRSKIQKVTSFLGEQESEMLGGSNSWVLSKSRSLTGNAWLANDPHLLLRDPPFWYWLHGMSPQHDVAGVSLPGVPVIVSGSNRKVSWGLTNSYIDVGDIFFVKKQEMAELKSERPVIWFRFWKFSIPFFFKKMEHAENGYPIVPMDNVPSGKVAVLRWTGFDLKAKDFESLMGVMQAQSVQDMDLRLSKIGVPSWNYVFADNRGGVGQRVMGRAFRKESEAPYSIQTQGLKAIEGLEVLSTDESPHLLNPKRGYIATANNRHWPSDSKFHWGRGYPQGFRAFRIEELIQKKIGHDRKSLGEIQCDTQAVDSRFLAPLLVKVSQKVGIPAWVSKELESWNFEVSADCRVCSLYRRWMDRLEESFELPIEGIYRTLQGFEGNAQSEDGARIKEAFSEAMKDLKATDEKGIPEWQAIHRNFFTHLSEDDRLTDRQSIAGPGDEHTVNPGTSNWIRGHYEQKWGASQRMLVEMATTPVMYTIFPGPILRSQKQKQGIRDLEKTDGPWMEWQSCQRKKMEFPLDITKVRFTEVSGP